MHGALSESLRAPSLVRLDGAQRLATVRHYEAPGRWEERLLLWKMGEEDWVVTAPDGQVYVEIRSWVDATPVTFTGNYEGRAAIQPRRLTKP